jgi:outer membrane protein assembly factor BamB
MLLSLAVMIPSLNRLALAADWPQFLGPTRNGHSTETGLNLDWRAQPPRVVWKVPLGAGFGSLIVVGDRLYTTAQRARRDYLLCFDIGTGKQVWALDAAPGFIDRWQKQGPGPRPTPAHDRGNLYCQMSDGDLLCVRATDGKEQWRANIFRAAGTRDRNGDEYYWGFSTSPLVEGDLVITQPGGKNNTSVLALDRTTGKVVWKAGTDPSGYASPIAVTIDGQRQLVVPTGQSVLGLDPARGTILWRYAIGNRFDANCATPVWAEDLLFVSAAYGTGCAALEIARDGAKWSVRERWRHRNLQNIFGTSIVLGDHIYGHHGDLGTITLRCLDLKTGEVKWTERQPGRSTMVAVQGHLLILDEQGGLRLVEARPERYQAKGEVRDLLEFKAWAAPALAQGRLYLRDQRHLICLDLGKQ